MTNEEHNKYIGWAFLANGIFQVSVLGFVLLMLMFIMAGMPSDGDMPPAFFALIFAFVGFINLIFLMPNFIAAYGILKQKHWARIAGIVAAALSAMNVPFGTLAAVYSFWFFCSENWKSVYPEAAGKLNTPPHLIDTPQQSVWEGYSQQEDGAYIHRTPPPPDWR